MVQVAPEPEPALAGVGTSAAGKARPMAVESHLKVAWRSTRVLATKNVQLKRAQYKACSCGCLPCTLFWELLFPVGIIALFAYIRTESDPVTTLDGWEQAWDEGSTEKRREVFNLNVYTR